MPNTGGNIRSPETRGLCPMGMSLEAGRSGALAAEARLASPEAQGILAAAAQKDAIRRAEEIAEKNREFTRRFLAGERISL